MIDRKNSGQKNNQQSTAKLVFENVLKCCDIYCPRFSLLCFLLFYYFLQFRVNNGLFRVMYM